MVGTALHVSCAVVYSSAEVREEDFPRLPQAVVEVDRGSGLWAESGFEVGFVEMVLLAGRGAPVAP